jgi:hypothetical protein
MNPRLAKSAFLVWGLKEKAVWFCLSSQTSKESPRRQSLSYVVGSSSAKWDIFGDFCDAPLSAADTCVAKKSDANLQQPPFFSGNTRVLSQ